MQLCSLSQSRSSDMELIDQLLSYNLEKGFFFLFYPLSQFYSQHYEDLRQKWRVFFFITLLVVMFVVKYSQYLCTVFWVLFVAILCFTLYFFVSFCVMSLLCLSCVTGCVFFSEQSLCLLQFPSVAPLTCQVHSHLHPLHLAQLFFISSLAAVLKPFSFSPEVSGALCFL